MLSILEIPFGYRKVGNWNQRPVYNEKEIVDFVNDNLGENHIGISVCTYKDGYPYLMFLPFDFDKTDEKSLKDVLVEAVKLYNYCVRCGYTCMITYSGRRGYHVYIKTKVKIYSKNQVEYVQELLRDLLNITLDEQVVGDIKRLMRIPGTFHPNGELCEILAWNDGKELDLNDIIPMDQADIKEEYKNTGVYTGNLHPMPCIEKLIKDRDYWIKNHPRKSFQPAQPIRMSWVALRLDEGMSEVEILDEAESLKWDDYNENICSYQIGHIEGMGYLPYSCKKLGKMGYCIIEDCPYKNGIVEDMKELGIL